MLLENSRKDAVEFWTNARRKKITISHERIAFIEGYQNIYPRIFQMIKDAKKEILLFISDHCLFEGIKIELNKALMRKAVKSNTKIWILRNTTMEDSDFKTIGQKKKKAMQGQILERFLEPDISLRSRFIVKDGEEALIFSKIYDDPHVREGEVCFWTDNKVLTSAMTTLFEKLWSNSDLVVCPPVMLKDCGTLVAAL